MMQNVNASYFTNNQNMGTLKLTRLNEECTVILFFKFQKMPKNTWSQYHIHCIIIQSNNITNNPKVVVTIMLYIELRNLCRVSIHFVQTCGTHLFLCIEFSKIFYSIVNTHVYCLCVNVSMSPSMLGYDLRTS